MSCLGLVLTRPSFLTPLAVADPPPAPGLRGLMQGTSSQVLRVSVGSSVQLATYDTFKGWAVSKGLRPDSVVTHGVAAIFSGFFLSIAMNPVDVVASRMYNMGDGLYVAHSPAEQHTCVV